MTASARPPSAARTVCRPAPLPPSGKPASDVAVHVLLESDRWPAEAEQIVIRAVKAALSVQQDAPRQGEIAVLLADDAHLAELNQRFRNRRGATDVLSFPGETGSHHFLPHIGDIAIAYERCARDAAHLGRPLAFHLSHLVIHGVLHCLGHDHEREEEARVMEACEREALAMLGWG
ncbi:MAG: rRNA maturation RNase YbeY, partial [Alphaproteobacteria bacterium]